MGFLIVRLFWLWLVVPWTLVSSARWWRLYLKQRGGSLKREALMDALLVTLGWTFLHLAMPLTMMVLSPSNAVADVYRLDVLTREEAQWLVEKSEAHALSRGGWETKRHRNYPTTDLAVKSLPDSQRVYDLVHERLFPRLAELFDVSSEDMALRDLFVVRYASDGQRRLQKHRDGSELSFGILLESTSKEATTEFVSFRHRLRDVQIGEAWLHPSLVLHRATAVDQGTRYVLIGFVNVSRPFYRTWGAWATILREWRVDATERLLLTESSRISRIKLLKRRFRHDFLPDLHGLPRVLLYVFVVLLVVLVVLCVDVLKDGIKLLYNLYHCPSSPKRRRHHLADDLLKQP